MTKINKVPVLPECVLSVLLKSPSFVFLSWRKEFYTSSVIGHWTRRVPLEVARILCFILSAKKQLFPFQILARSFSENLLVWKERFFLNERAFFALGYMKLYAQYKSVFQTSESNIIKFVVLFTSCVCYIISDCVFFVLKSADVQRPRNVCIRLLTVKQRIEESFFRSPMLHFFEVLEMLLSCRDFVQLFQWITSYVESKYGA